VTSCNGKQEGERRSWSKTKDPKEDQRRSCTLIGCILSLNGKCMKSWFRSRTSSKLAGVGRSPGSRMSLIKKCLAEGWVWSRDLASLACIARRRTPKSQSYPQNIENALRWTTPSRSHSSWPMYHTSNNVGAVVGSRPACVNLPNVRPSSRVSNYPLAHDF
jgi:hypothetical protein